MTNFECLFLVGNYVAWTFCESVSWVSSVTAGKVMNDYGSPEWAYIVIIEIVWSIVLFPIVGGFQDSFPESLRVGGASFYVSFLCG